MSICLGSFLGDLELETGIRCVQDVEEVVNPLTVLTPPSPPYLNFLENLFFNFNVLGHKLKIVKIL